MKIRKNTDPEKGLKCSLCFAVADYYTADRKREYYRCPTCDLIFADPASFLCAEQEKEIYDFHQNDPNDVRYRSFLSQLTNPMLKKLKVGANGLDFGCGPGPVLHLMLEEQGMKVSTYDIFYYPDTDKLLTAYDFVTCTEVVEHFYNPAKGWAELINLIRPGGWLGVMTWLYVQPGSDRFKQWSYKNDPTHVSFYSPQTMQWLAQQFNLQLEIISDRVVLFKKLGSF